METKNKVAIIGGTGKSGQFLIRQLLNEKIPVKMLHRKPENIQIETTLIEVISGDARDYRAVHSLIEGCGAVISTLGQPKNEPSIFSEATRNVIAAMEFFRIRRYIVTTGINVDTPQDKKTGYTEAATEWMKNNYPKTTSDKQTEFDLLVSSGLDWTLVRLPLIELTAQKFALKISLEDCPGEKISATSLAEFLSWQLRDKTYIKQSPFVANG
jgi:putative NADH-flavin reductase